MKNKALFGLLVSAIPKWVGILIVVTCVAGALFLVTGGLLIWYDQEEDLYGFQHILFNTWVISFVVCVFGMFFVILPCASVYATLKAWRDLGLSR